MPTTCIRMFSGNFANSQRITHDLKAAQLKVLLPPKWECIEEEELPPWENIVKSPIWADPELQEIRDLAAR